MHQDTPNALMITLQYTEHPPIHLWFNTPTCTPWYPSCALHLPSVDYTEVTMGGKYQEINKIDYSEKVWQGFNGKYVFQIPVAWIIAYEKTF